MSVEIQKQYGKNLTKLKKFLPRDFAQKIAEDLDGVNPWDVSRAFNNKLSDLEKLGKILDKATEMAEVIKEQSKLRSKRIDKIANAA